MTDLCFECRAYLKCPLDVPGDDCEEFEPEGFRLRDLAIMARSIRAYDEFGKSMEKVRRLSLAKTANQPDA